MRECTSILAKAAGKSTNLQLSLLKGTGGRNTLYVRGSCEEDEIVWSPRSRRDGRRAWEAEPPLAEGKSHFSHSHPPVPPSLVSSSPPPHGAFDCVPTPHFTFPVFRPDAGSAQTSPAGVNEPFLLVCRQTDGSTIMTMSHFCIKKSTFFSAAEKIAEQQST